MFALESAGRLPGYVLVPRRLPVVIGRGAAALVAALVLAACGAGAEAQTGPAAADPATAGDPTAAGELDALDFTLTTLDGEPFDAAQLRGTPTILWFWAPWCTICRAEAPELARLAEDVRDVTVVGVPGRGEVQAMRDFVADTGTGDLTHLVDTDGLVWARFGVIAQPAYAFVGADGEVQVVNGSLGEQGLREAAQRLAAG